MPVVAVASPSSDVRQLEQFLQILEQPLRLGIRRVAHHQIAQRIDDVDAAGLFHRLIVVRREYCNECLARCVVGARRDQTRVFGSPDTPDRSTAE